MASPLPKMPSQALWYRWPASSHWVAYASVQTPLTARLGRLSSNVNHALTFPTGTGLAGFRTSAARAFSDKLPGGAKPQKVHPSIPLHPHVPRPPTYRKSFLARVWENVKADRKNLYLIVVSSIAMTAAARIAKTKREAMIAHDNMESQLRAMRAEADAALNVVDACKQANATVVNLVGDFEKTLPRNTPSAIRSQTEQLRQAVEDAVSGKLPELAPGQAVATGGAGTANQPQKFSGLV